MRLGMYEILEKTSTLSTKAEKIEYLRKNWSVGLGIVLKMAFDKNLKWALPDGAPPYRPSLVDDSEGMLYNEVKRLYLFHEGGNTNLTQKRRELLFQQLLESVDKDDALLIVGVKDKKLPFKGITYKLIEEAYPGLLVYA
jgi:hypothetical protein